MLVRPVCENVSRASGYKGLELRTKIMTRGIHLYVTSILSQRRQWHSGTLAWKIPWMEEPGRLQSMGSRRVGHDWTTSLSFFTFMHWRRKWQPTSVFLPEESQGWWADISGVTQSRTRLKRLRTAAQNWLLKNWCFWTAVENSWESLGLQGD